MSLAAEVRRLRLDRTESPPEVRVEDFRLTFRPAGAEGADDAGGDDADDSASRAAWMGAAILKARQGAGG